MTLQQKRLQCKQLKEQISAMKRALDNEGHRISPEISNDVEKFLSESDDEFLPFMRFFWQEQHKYINSLSSTAICYHPMIIKVLFESCS